MLNNPCCRQCGLPIPPDAPQGVCPNCVLRLGLEAGPGGGPGTTVLVGDSPPPSVDELARHFPQLEILELLGQGGMGAVYKARQKTLDRLVALKILPTHLSRDAAFTERFTREARALARLNHPHVVMVFDFGRAGELFYFLMEYVDGVNLRQLMASGELAPSDALNVVPQICEALQYAHEMGVVHRDVKPENVLLDASGRVKIADFGLAKLVGTPAGTPTLTRTHQVMGTPHYMAPEQMQDPLAVDHRADIYSLGVVFYELLTGELPLGRFAPPSQAAGVDAGLDAVVMRALEREPGRRYQHASEVKTDVESLAAAVAPPPGPRREGRRLACPFTIPDPNFGITRAHGIVRWDGNQLGLEFEIRDEIVGVYRSRPRLIEIPRDELVWFRFRHGFFFPKLLFQTEHLATVADVPHAVSGQVSLQVARRDRELAESLAAAVRSSVGLESEIDHDSDAGDSWTWDSVAAGKPAGGPPQRWPTAEAAPARHKRVMTLALAATLAVLLGCLLANLLPAWNSIPVADDGTGVLRHRQVLDDTSAEYVMERRYGWPAVCVQTWENQDLETANLSVNALLCNLAVALAQAVLAGSIVFAVVARRFDLRLLWLIFFCALLTLVSGGS